MLTNDVETTRRQFRHEETHRRTSLTWVDNKQQEMWCCQQSSAEAPLQKMRKAYLTRIL